MYLCMERNVVMENRYHPEHWKMGFFYVNPKDPLLVVPKLNGMGWTLNFGHKKLIRYLLVLLVLLVVYVAVRFYLAR